MKTWIGTNPAKLAPVLLALALIAMLAGGCCKTVYVPVSTCPQPPPLAMPLLAVDQLPTIPQGTKPTPEQTTAAIRALGLDHVTLKKTLEQCVMHLDAYRNTPAP